MEGYAQRLVFELLGEDSLLFDGVALEVVPQLYRVVLGTSGEDALAGAAAYGVYFSGVEAGREERLDGGDVGIVQRVGVQHAEVELLLGL